MAIRKRFALSENNQDRLRDRQGKFLPNTYLSNKEELQSNLGRVSWNKESGNTYTREEKEKFDVSTLFLYASIVAIIILK